MKFTYRQKAGGDSPYQWRDPYSGAHYQEGWKTDPRDDKGSFTYGKKELWYLERAETKSHILKFNTEDRDDGYGVAHKYNYDKNDPAEQARQKPMQALRSMSLYSRFAGLDHPIKTVQFKYDYSLCKGVENNINGGGKLTLTKVYFEYGNSSRGSLNPYVFTYSDLKANYNTNAYDRWGNYKPYLKKDYDQNHDFPYVNQDPAEKASLDRNAAAWSLEKIQLPSGGLIIVDYEIDDYGYVQHKPVMQMTELVSPDATGKIDDSDTTSYTLADDAVVWFKLEKPVSKDSVADQRAEVMKYLDANNQQIAFKIKVNLRSSEENFGEYISGYAYVNMNGEMKLKENEDGKYAYGSFTLAKEYGYHPFKLRAWQHIRTNQPDLANSGRKLSQTDDVSKRIGQIRSLGNIFSQVRQMFGGFYNFCDKKGWGQEVVRKKVMGTPELTRQDKIRWRCTRSSDHDEGSVGKQRGGYLWTGIRVYNDRQRWKSNK